MTKQEVLIDSRIKAKSPETVQVVLDTDKDGVDNLRANLIAVDTDVLYLELATILPIARE
jgi:hypothetical protein